MKKSDQVKYFEFAFRKQSLEVLYSQKFRKTFEAANLEYVHQLWMTKVKY